MACSPKLTSLGHGCFLRQPATDASSGRPCKYARLVSLGHGCVLRQPATDASSGRPCKYARLVSLGHGCVLRQPATDASSGRPCKYARLVCCETAEVESALFFAGAASSSPAVQLNQQLLPCPLTLPCYSQSLPDISYCRKVK